MKREELYDLVWSTPMTKASKKFGISDVALRKTCVRHNIPVPPAGYWAKLAHGKKVTKPALPPRKTGVADDVPLNKASRPSVPEFIEKIAQEALDHEAKEEAKIVVPTEMPEPLHPIAANVKRALLKAKPDEEGFLAVGAGTLPNVKVGYASVSRATILLDTFFRNLPSRGFEVALRDDKLRLAVRGEYLGVSLSETRDRRSHTPSREELKAQQRLEESRLRYPSLYSGDRKAYREWDYFPSGRLSLEIFTEDPRGWGVRVIGRWYDRPTKRVEDYLNACFAQVVGGAAEIAHERAIAAEKARLAAEELDRRRRAKERLEREERRRAYFHELADRFAAHKKLKSLLHFVEGLQGVGQDPVSLKLLSDLRSTSDEEEQRFSIAGLTAAIRTFYVDEDFGLPGPERPRSFPDG